MLDIEKELGEHSSLWLGEYKFDRDDPPAKDILSAYIRAKFWGANVTTYRPSIKTVLDFIYKKRHTFLGGLEQAILHKDTSR